MATVDRVLPWRRGALPAEEIAPLLSAYRLRHPKAPTALISRAYAEAANAHTGRCATPASRTSSTRCRWR